MEQPEILQYFEYEHLPAQLQAISKPFCDLADWLVEATPDNDQRRMSLEHLLIAKDAAVRAALPPRK